MMRKLKRFFLGSYLLCIVFLVKGQFVDIDINSGDPSFPFPQFLEYTEGKTLAKYNAEGVTHADMEKTMRDAYEIMSHRCRYQDGTHCGVPYIVFNPASVPHPGAEPLCSEGDGYMLLAAALFADQPTFNGLWMRIHDHKLSKVIKYKDCQELRPTQKSCPYMAGWHQSCDENMGANDGSTHSASDGDFDIAMALLIAYKQWGEFMYHNGTPVIDACGDPISYKEAAQRAIKALVDTVPDYMDNGALAGMMSGDIGIDGYVKGGNTWGELTQWRFTQTTYPWATSGPTLGGNYGSNHIDYNAPSYFKEFYHWLENEDGDGNSWQINQFKRAEASSDWLMGDAYSQGYIASLGWVNCTTDGVFTYTSFNSGEDFRASWRTILNYLWNGNPDYTWNPTTHQVEPGGNSFEYDIALRHAELCKSPRLGGAQKCKQMGMNPDPGQPSWWGVAQIPQAWGPTGDTELHFAGSNYALGASAPAAVASEDLELIADMYRQSELVWDDASALSSGLSEDERYILSTPKYFHGMFRILGLLVNSGNLHAPKDMVSAANVKVYMSVDKTYAYQGDNLDYTVQFRNFGSKKAEGVTITTPLDPDFTFISANKGGVYNSSTHTITWSIGEIPGFKSGQLNATIDSVAFKVQITDKVNPRVCLTSTISGNNFDDWVSNEYPNHVTYTMERNCVDVLANRTLKVAKTANRTEMNPSDIVKFTVNFENESADDSWLNGGRSNVYLSYGNYLPNINSTGEWDNTSFYQYYRFWNDAAEAYINMNNYRFSYYMNDINKGFKAPDNPNGWIFSVDNQNDLDKYNYNPASGPITFDYQKIPAGSDAFGSWNQRLMIRFADVLTATTTHVFDKLDSDYLLHKGVTGPALIRSRLFTDPATNMKDKVSDDWSYDVKIHNTCSDCNPLDGQKLKFFPISPIWADYNNLGAALNNYSRHSCSPDVDNYDRVLVEEFDGYTWRRIQGRGPLPGKEAYNVVIVDTIPIELVWRGFVDDDGLGVTATYTPASPGSNYTGIVKWTVPEMLVGEKDELVYEAVAVDIGCPTDDVFFENASWIYSDTDSPDSSRVDLMITCTELPPIIDPQTSLFKRSDVSLAQVGDVISYELEYINTEGAIVEGNLSTQNGWMALGNGNVPLAKGYFSGDVNENTGIPAPYFFANEKSYGVNGTLETTWDCGNSSQFYFVFRYTSGTPYAGGFNGVCLRVTPLPSGQGTIRFEVIDGSTVVGTETSNVSYPTDASGQFNPINFKVELIDNAIYVYVNDFETVLKSYSGITTMSPGYVGVYSGPTGNQQKMLALKTSFDYAFDITLFDQLPVELGNIANISGGGSFNASENKITWPLVSGPIAKGESIIYSYNAEVISCGNYITNMGMATVYGMDTLKVLNSVDCGTTVCTPPTNVSLDHTNPSILPVTLCQGETVDLIAGAAHTGAIDYEFFLDGASLGAASPTSTYTASKAGSYTVIAYDHADPTCFTTSVTSVDISVDPAFTVNLGTDVAACSNATIALDAGTGNSYIWDDAASSTTQILSPTNSGTYSVTVTRGACEATDDITVTITPIPTVTITPNTDQSLCSGDDITITASVAEPGNWEYTLYNGFNPDIGPQAGTDFTVSAAGTYSVEAVSTDNATCSGQSSSIDVSIASAPTVTLTTPQNQVCDGSAILTATAPGSDWEYAFYNSFDIDVQIQSADDTYETSIADTYYAIAFKVGNPNCNGRSNDLAVAFGTSPIVSVQASSQLDYCAGSTGSIVVTSIPGANYSWSNSQGALVGGTNTYASATAETYAVAVTDGFCTTTLDNIVVSETPQPTYTITATGATNICEGATFPTIELTVAGGMGPFDIVYSDGQGADQTLIGQTSPVTLTPTANTADVYEFSLISLTDQASSCTAAIVPTETVTVTVSPKPVFAFTQPNPVCDNQGDEDLSVYVSTSDAGTFSYTCVESASAIDATTGVFDVDASGDGTYTIEVVLDDNGCVSDAKSQSFVVYPSPTATVSGATQVCAGGQEVLTGQQSGGTAPYDNHEWQQPSSVLSGIYTQTPTFQTNTVDTYPLSYSFTDANGCIATVDHTVDVVSLPSASINSPMPSYCTGDSPITLDATFATVSTAGGSYAWSIDGTPVTEIDPAGLGTGSFNLELVYTYGCAAPSVSQSFTVAASPTADIDDLGLLCSGDAPLQLTSSNENPALGTGVWSGTGVSGGGIFDPATAGNFAITYTYTEPSGVCDIAVTRTITVNQSPVISFPPIASGCAGDPSFSLSASATPVGGTGIYSALVGVTDDGTVIPAVLTPGTNYAITYTYTTAAGCVDAAMQNYSIYETSQPTVLQNPVTTVSPTPHDPMQVTSAADSYTWYNDAHTEVLSGATASSYDPAHTADGIYRYYVTQTSNGCESEELEVVISVSNCGVPAPIVSNVRVCNGDAIPTLTATGTGAGTITWYQDVLKTTPITTGNSYTPPSLPPLNGSVTYYVAETDGCEGAAAPIVVSLHPLPSLSFTMQDDICQEALEVNLFADPSGGEFTVNGTPLSLFDPSLYVDESVNVVYTYTSPTSGCSNDLTESVFVHATPSPAITGLNSTYCTNDVAVALTHDQSGGTATWSASPAGVSGGILQPGVFAGTASTDVTVTLNYEDNFGCKASTSAITQINDLPTVSVSPIPGQCADITSLDLSAYVTPTGGVFGGHAAVSGNTFNPQSAGVGSHTLDYTYTNTTTGCSTTKAMTVKVLALPVVSFNFTTLPLCLEDGGEQLSGHVVADKAPSASSTPMVYSGSSAIVDESPLDFVFYPELAGAGTYTITVDYTDIDGCSAQANADIEVQTVAMPTVTGNTANVQHIQPTVPSSYTLEATGLGGTLRWFKDDMASQPHGTGASVVPTETSIGQHSYYVYEENSNGCKSELAEVIWEVVQCSTNEPSVSGAQTVCQGEPIPTITAVGDGGEYHWYQGTTELTTGTTFTPPVSTPRVYNFNLIEVNTSENCESPAHSFSVEVLPKPDIRIANNGNEFCFDDTNIHHYGVYDANGTTGTITNNGAEGLQGNSDDFLPSSVATTNAPIAVAFYYEDNATGCRDTITVSPMVREVPLPTAMSPQVENVQKATGIIRATPTSSGTLYWYDDGMNELTTGTSYTHFPHDQLGSWNYFVREYSGGCYSSPLAVEYIIQPCTLNPPTLVQPNPYKRCLGESFDPLMAQGEAGAQFHWYPIGASVATTANPFVVKPKSAKYFVTQETDECESPSLLVELKIIEVSKPEIVPQDDVCQADLPVQLVLKENYNGIVRWYADAALTTQVHTGTSFEPSSITPGSTFWYTVMEFDECLSETASVSYQILETPTAPIAAPVEVCEGTALQAMTAQALENGALYWVDQAGNYLGTGNSFTPNLSQVSTVETVPFGVYLERNGCQSDTTRVLYDYIAKPALPDVIAHNMCFKDDGTDETPQLQSLYIGGGETWWYDSLQQVKCAASKTCMLYEVDQPGVYTYYAQRKVGACFSDFRAIQYEAYEMPQPRIFGNDSICAGAKAQVYAVELPDDEKANSTFEWTVTGNRVNYTYGSADKQTYRAIDFIEPGVEYVILKQTRNGCVGYDSMRVSIAPPPNAWFETVNPGNPGIMHIYNQSEQEPVVTPDSSYQVSVDYYWDFGRITDTAMKHINIDQAGGQEPISLKYDYGYYDITLQAVNSHGCNDIVTRNDVFMDVSFGLHVPNAVAPTNNSYKVREFRPKGFNLAEYQIWIYDKWGNLVWYSDKLTENGEPAEGWNGQCNGKMLDAGAYVYKIEAKYVNGDPWKGKEKDNGKFTTFGNVYLVR